MFGYFAYLENVKTAEDNFTYVISGSLNQTRGNLQSFQSHVEKLAQELAYNFQLQEVLQRQPVSYSDQYDDYLTVQRILDNVERDEGFSVRLYLDTPRRFLQDQVRYFAMQDLPADRRKHTLEVRSNSLYWYYSLDGGELVFHCYADMNSYSSFAHLASITIDIPETQFRSLLQQSAAAATSRMFLYSSDTGVILSSLEPGMVGQAISPELGKGVAEAKQEEGVLKGTNGKLNVYAKLSQSPLIVVTEIPESELTNRSSAIFHSFLWLALSILSCTFVLAYVLATGITGRVRRLAEAMGAIEKNDFRIKVTTVHQDEVGILYRKFNWMVERIRTLIEDVYKSGLEKKEAELNLLQSQINPHFLYNTLNSIHWMALRHQAPEISSMVRHLSDFLRLSLNVAKRTTIESELQHVQAYFAIQKYRFEERIHMEVDVHPEVRQILTLSLILQPLVENALLHGILPDEGRVGTIAIKGHLEDGLVVLEVSDNGRGIPDARLEQLARCLKGEDDPAVGRGVRNVHQRIRIHYGDEYGLNLMSAPGIGTTCIILFPAETEAKAAENERISDSRDII